MFTGVYFSKVYYAGQYFTPVEDGSEVLIVRIPFVGALPNVGRMMVR